MPGHDADGLGLPLLRESAPAKVNLTLRVLGRRADGYHELESLVAFADLADELRLDLADDVALELSGPFAKACGVPNDNLVMKAARSLALPAGKFGLEKRIPVAAGLGGGSADAAAALRLVARVNEIEIDDPRIIAAARKTGADVAVCLEGRARVMRGIGEHLSAPATLPRLPALLVNPGVALPTRGVFTRFSPEEGEGKPIGDVPADAAALIPWLDARSNDLTRSATSLVPTIADILAALEALPGCRLARMSGSGPTCFGLFDDEASASAAAEQLSKAHGNWWICATTIG
jgi:4-diphosphocytidyl-2-C-methyl-D-erythritol kinase